MDEDVTEPMQGQEEEVGIMVFAQEARGGTQVGFRLMGGFSIIAAPILLELATKAARQQLGLGE